MKYNPAITKLECQASGIVAMMHQVDSCQFHPWPQDDVVRTLMQLFRETSRTVERLRNDESASRSAGVAP